MPIEPDIAKSLSEKSDAELIAILENPTDWMPPVVEFARSELARRSVSTEQITQTIDINAKQKADELQQRSVQPLSTWDKFFTVLYGGILGLIGLIFVGFQASRLKSDGYLLKSKTMWRIYFIAFGVRVAIVLLLVAYFVITSTGH
jgi:hypothetical protein